MKPETFRMLVVCLLFYMASILTGIRLAMG